jgi:lipoate-protein ligase A
VPFSLVFLKGCSIFQQLQLEEALLRADKRNWCLINQGASSSIVLGISGKPELLVDLERLATKPVPLIRRFSGGGTVFVDPGTIFITWICNAAETAVPCCPDKIHRWAGSHYSAAFPQIHLLENDYVIGERKCGGNAQYLCRGRWLHHTSFLWEYDPENMAYLKMPSKTPRYRQQRTHEEFLCTLKPHFVDEEEFYKRFLSYLHQQFSIITIPFEEAWKTTDYSHRKATCMIAT